MNINMLDNEVHDSWNKLSLESELEFDKVFRALYPVLCRFAHTFLNDTAESEEVVHDVFLNLWQNRSRMVIRGSLKAYLYQSVHNLSINRLEHRRTHRYSPNRLASQDEWTQIHQTYVVTERVVQMLEAEDTEKIIKEAIDLLPEKCREIFILSRYLELSNDEIARKLHLSQNTVRVQIFRALEVIRKNLDKILLFFL